MVKHTYIIGISTAIFVLLIIGISVLFLKKDSKTETTTVTVRSQTATPSPSPTPVTLTLQSIFANQQFQEPENAVTLIATGDVIPARSVNVNTLMRNNFLWSWETTSDYLKTGDITLIDLETPIFDQCPQTQEGFKFCGEDGHMLGMVSSGVDVANIANNHFGNYGIDGVNKTKALLAQNDILISGDGITYTTVKGTKFAFVGFNDIGYPENGFDWANNDLVASRIQEADNNADVVVASYHWGVEYVSQPSSRQIELAHLSVDNGADLVIGNHPHWIQPVEIYKNKLIMYAHGNFIFDQMWSEETKEGVIGTYVFENGSLVNVSYMPVYIKDYGQPSFAKGDRRDRILKNLETQSYILEKNLGY